MAKDAYCIVHDPGDGSWWIQGNEGRVGGRTFGTIDEAATEARAMEAAGYLVDTDYYYVDSGDGDGPDWGTPRTLAGD